MSNLEEQLESITPSDGPGGVLKAKREEYKWAIESVAQALYLSTPHIKSLEEDRYDQLPGSTYVIGYWRSYARLLGIDIEETIEANKRNLQVLQPQGNGINVNLGKVQKSDHGKGLIWLLLTTLVLAAVGYAWKTGILDSEKILDVTRLGEEIAQVTEVVEQATEVKKEVNLVPASTADIAIASSALTTAVVEQPEPSAVTTTRNQVAATTESTTSVLTTSEESTVRPAAVKDVNLLTMQLEKDSWLDVRDKSNKRLIYRSGKAGELINLRGEPPFYVYIGTPDSVKVTYLNEDVPFESHQSGLFARFKLGKVLENL